MLELYWDLGGPEQRTIVATSREPEFLARVRRALNGSLRRVDRQRAGIGAMVEGKLVLEGQPETVTVSLSVAGFVVGDEGASNDSVFYSPDLAFAVDDLCHTKTGERLPRLFVAGLCHPDWIRILNERPRNIEDLLMPRPQ